MVVHGIGINGDGAYEFGAGVSSLTDDLPLETTIPAAGDQIDEVGRHRRRPPIGSSRVGNRD